MAALGCYLVKNSLRYDNWRRILGTDEVPILLPFGYKALFGEENVSVYDLNLDAFSPEQRKRLIAWIAKEYGDPREKIEAGLAEFGFPIRAEDVIVGGIDHQFKHMGKNFAGL